MRKQLIVITSYPDPRTGIKRLNAVAWHAAKTLKRLSETCRVLCIAERVPGSAKKLRVNHDLTVYRSYTKGSPYALFQTLPHILKNWGIKNVLIQFEFNIFGGFLPVLSMPLFLLLLKMMGKNVIMEIHQVVPDIAVLKDHINVHSRGLQMAFTAGLRVFYAVVGLLTDTVIVLEEQLKTRLSAYIPHEKIFVVPLGAAARVVPRRAAAKRALGIQPEEFTVVVFGFVNWYKGSDWIADVFSQLKTKRIRLVLAGGKNPTLTGKDHYESFYENVKNQAKQSPTITLSGFVSDAQVPLYFGAADLVLLPYRVFMSASGPLSLALSYKKPFLLSERLGDYKRSEDFKEAMIQAGVTGNELFFPMNKQALARRIRAISIDSKALARLERFAAILAAKRDESKVIDYYQSCIFRHIPKTAWRTAWRVTRT